MRVGSVFKVVSHRVPFELYIRPSTKRLREVSEADGVLVEVKDGVDVLHEGVTEEPGVVTKTEVLTSERGNAVGRALLNLTGVEAGETCQNRKIMRMIR